MPLSDHTSWSDVLLSVLMMSGMDRLVLPPALEPSSNSPSSRSVSHDGVGNELCKTINQVLTDQNGPMAPDRRPHAIRSEYTARAHMGKCRVHGLHFEFLGLSNPGMSWDLQIVEPSNEAHAADGSGYRYRRC
ncbi:hypothetical protein PGTUg99_033351 [Puccinia graminis f. sp. tritici]|uniref:Uncharacterized protein n=1 Tax=Puccinia graminis f. sp. tritici TaxID=56615 RepID=A0A5B0RPL4_PUCGR|nr:hypothetical protein PGTUg99_033351 [Puccinia graminis f. sp. tritici]